MTTTTRRFGATLAACTALVLAAPVAVTAANAATTKTPSERKIGYLERALLSSTQRPCAYEDGSGSRLPCRWNTGAHGKALEFIVYSTGRDAKGRLTVNYLYTDGHTEHGTI